MKVATPPQDTVHDTEVAERYERLVTDLILEGLGVPRRPITVLDLACGTGLTALAVANRLPAGSRVVALSENRRRLNDLHHRLTPDLRRFIYPRRQNRQRLPFASAAFDLVYAGMALEQLAPPQLYLRQALRVLRPDGRIVLAMPTRECSLELIGTFGRLLGAHLPPAEWQPLLSDRGHLHEIDSWTQILERASVSDIAVIRRKVTLELGVPLSRDPLFANVLVPMWLGEDPSAHLAALEQLDRYVREPLALTHHLALVTGRATRTAPEITVVR